MQAKSENKFKVLLRNIISVGLVQVANYLLPLISIPIIVRIIGPTNFGTINYYTAFTAYFILLINYGFDYTGTRFIAVESNNVNKRNEHFTKILYAKILLFVISSVIFYPLIFIVAKSSDEVKVATYTFLITISYVITPNWFYQGMQDLTKTALFNLATKAIYTVLIFLLIQRSTDFLLQPLILSAVQIAISIISLIVAIKKYNIVLVKITLKSLTDLLWDDKLIFLTMIASNLYTDTNIVILGAYESKENIGYFTAAWKFIFIFLMIISFPLSQAFFPYIAETFSKSISNGISQVKRMLPIVIYFTLACSIVIFLLGDYLITSFYGEEFAPAVYVFRVLTLVPVLSYINTILGLQTMVNLKMDKAYFYIILSGGIFSVLFNLIVIRIYGYKGGAWSWIFTELIITVAMHLYLKSKGYNLWNSKLYSLNNVISEVKILLIKFKNKPSNSIQ